MCGITGIFNYQKKQPIDSLLLKKMCRSIQYRGPDDEGFFIDDAAGIGLGHRRLSIIDLQTGKQPMSNTDETIWIVFNGEIYNFPELKKELQEKGYGFRTKSDTEVIIYLYEAYGEQAFQRLNGIFAFAIFDKRNQSVIIARDHFGVKPLYYTICKGRLLFGSEIKAILVDKSINKELDLEAFNSFLTFSYNPSPQTMLKNIQKLAPGHYLKIASNGRIEINSFWNYIPQIQNNISEKEAIESYQQLLERAVKRQMISDVAVGLFLSGGVDSAVIGFLMQKYSREQIKTFSIGFEGKGDYNELGDARKTSDFIGSEHYDLVASRKDYLHFFLKSFKYTEEPIAVTTIPALFYVAKLASSHVKVVLAGQGADEPLAGYQRYIGEKNICKYGYFLRLLPFQKLAEIIPRNERFKRAIFASQFKSEIQRFLGIYTIFTPMQKEQLIKTDVKRGFINVNEKLVEKYYKMTHELNDSLAKLLFIDTRMHLPDNLLLFGDKMTMANSIEMRVPFLDIELVKFLESLPSAFKIKGFKRKYLHKKAVQKWLPKEITNRKKRPFTTPMDVWLQSDLANSAKRLFNSNDSASKNYFNINIINNMIDQHQARRQNYQRQIFTLLSFELWHKIFFDNKVIDEDLFSY